MLFFVSRRWSGAAALAGALSLILSACGTSSSSGSPTPSRQIAAVSPSHALRALRLNYFADTSGTLAKTLDPAQATDSPSSDTIALANANLVHILPNNQVAPDLATWTVGRDRLSYTFTIRPNARFANGHHVTARDAVLSIKRALAPSTGSPVAATYLGLIKGATQFNAGKAGAVDGLAVLGPRTLRISLTRPAAYFLDALAYPTADVLDPSVVGNKAASPVNNYLTNNCPGNQGAGPFEFVCMGRAFYPAGRTPSYTLKPNPYYFGRKPRITIQLPAGATVDTNYRQYQAGQIDTTLLPTPDIKQWVGSSQYLSYPTSIVAYITPNTRMAPFSNVHCRLALSYALDRETIANSLLNRAAAPAYVIVPRGFQGYYNGRISEPHLDLQRARAEVAQCPYRSVPVKFSYPTGSSDRDNVGTAVVAMMTQVGFHAAAKPLTANDWDTVVSQPLSKTGTQLVRNGWQQDYPDPQDYVSLLLRSDAAYNIGGWKNSRFDRLTNQADVESVPARRAQLYRQAEHIALSEGAWIAMTNNLGHALVKPYVHGLIGTAAYGDLVPRNDDWGNVSISSH